MRLAILGFGLVGGSLARALHERAPEHTIVSWSPSGRGPARALSDGVIAGVAGTMEDALQGADVVVLAAPPLASVELLREVANHRGSALADEATVTDVVSTKARLLEAADAAGLPFVGGHPMAGRETAGYEAAEAALFVGRPWVLVPGAHARPTDIERIEAIATAVGAAPVRMTAADHDDAVAAISHLPLVLAAALVEAVAGQGSGGSRPDWPAARALAASGWRDMTRLARGDVAMGAGIAATNASALSERVRAVRDVLDGWLIDLDGREGEPDVSALERRLRNARDRLGPT